jgi:hypothetical protein
MRFYNIHMLTIFLLPDEMAVVKMPATAPVPQWSLASTFFSITRTPDELSIVCSDELLPPTVQAERGWRCLQVAGPLDFTLVGVLASLATPLQAANVSIFAISTYETDYLLIKASQCSQAMAALQAAGHRIIEKQ